MEEKGKSLRQLSQSLENEVKKKSQFGLFLGGEIELYLSPGYKNYFDQVKTKFRDLTHTIIPLITESILSLEEVKTFLGTRFHELKSHLSTAVSFDDVIVLIKKVYPN